MRSISYYSLLIGFILAACSNPPEGQRTCLTGEGICSDVQIPREYNPDSGSSENGMADFICTATPSATSIKHLEVLKLDIYATGGTQPYKITRGLEFPIPSFAGTVNLYGNYLNSGTESKVVGRTVHVEDSAGHTATCVFQVTVLPRDGNDTLACTMTPDTYSVLSGSVVTFSLKGSGGDGNYTFSDFIPMPGRTVNNDYIRRISAGESQVPFIYLSIGIRMPQITVKSAGNTAMCRTVVFVNTSPCNGFDPSWDWRFIPPWWDECHLPIINPNPALSCDVITKPNPGTAGAITSVNVKVTSQLNGTYEIVELSSYNVNKKSDSLFHELNQIPRANALERKIRFLRPDQHLITVKVRGTQTGVSTTCSTYHYARPAKVFVLGPDKNQIPSVMTFNRLLDYQQNSFTANDGAMHGARVAVGDVNGDGYADIIVGSGPGGNNRIQVRDALDLNKVIFDFDAFDESDDGGVFVAAGDVNADGRTDIIAGQNNGPSIKVFNGSSTTIKPSTLFTLKPYGDTLPFAGIRVAGGDLNGDGYSDIVTIPGAGGSALIKTFSGKTQSSILSEFEPFGDTLSGAFVAVGDTNGDGRADIIVSLDRDLDSQTNMPFSPLVKIFSGINGSLLKSLSPFPDFRGGIRVAAADTNQDGISEVIVAMGPHPSPVLPLCWDFQVKGIKVNGTTETLFQLPDSVFHCKFPNGIHVGGEAGGL